MYSNQTFAIGNAGIAQNTYVIARNHVSPWLGWWWCTVVIAIAGCGRSATLRDIDAEVLPAPNAEDESCDGQDNDLDGRVDEDFRDDQGRYISGEHCGGCNQACIADGSRVVTAQCALIDKTPTCAATQCETGFGPSRSGRCVPRLERLCLPCQDDGDCGDLAEARCVDVGGEPRCVVACDLGCPDGYRCQDDGNICIPAGGSCRCDPGDTFDLACALADPEGNRCAGTASCDDGTLSECAVPEEVCDEVDNDCDGLLDEGFRDEREAYSIDIAHCGQCGVDCREGAAPGVELVCGGDPFAPSCVLRCTDADDGVQVGDRVDGDRTIATGCECLVSDLSDVPGPVGAQGAALDANCDGADGVVVESFYVAPDGDDEAPGSPTRPLRTLREAMRRSAESLDTDAPRPHVYIASGNYTESIQLPDGVSVHGGYRRDYLALDPSGFRVEVRAPADSLAPGAPALRAVDVGTQTTLVEWVSFRGADASGASEPAYGVLLQRTGAGLTLRDCDIRAGVGGTGEDGTDGSAGIGPDRGAGHGAAPRGAIETAGHQCIADSRNVVTGGTGGESQCGDVRVRGGVGGAAGCPDFAAVQNAGGNGGNAGALAGGAGGRGGQDSQGPITGRACSERVCCGLADFTVPSDFRSSLPGSPGRNGTAGDSGRGCGRPLGTLDADAWIPGTAEDGTDGAPGSGGGGGGAGGGAEMTWVDDLCEFVDGLGGGGGGGGAGGCGGTAGTAGTSGGPSVGMLIIEPRATPTLENLRIFPGDGGRGGRGGAGGDGGPGGPGGFGGSISRDARSTPTLAGPFPGSRGGRGGQGGSGGGGGGGCGGASIGVWVQGGSLSAEEIRRDNEITTSRAGGAGQGGGGAAPGGNGASGGAIDVLAR